MNFHYEFDGDEAFEATRKAEDWLRKRGYSIGSMERNYPRGIKHGDYRIAKWNNLSSEDKKLLDGKIVGNHREGPVYVEIYNTEIKT